MRIRKVAEDRYHVLVKDEYTDIDEFVDAPKLKAMLEKERLVGPTPEDVSTALETNDEPGHEAPVIYRRRISA